MSLNRSTAFLVCCLLLLGVLSPVAAGAVVTPGSLDMTFSDNGKAQTRFAQDTTATGEPASYGATGTAITTDAQRRIVVAGSWSQPTYASSGAPAPRRSVVVARYQPDGRLDPTFGADGRAIFSFTGSAFANDVIAVGSKIVVVGSLQEAGDEDMMALRLDAGGSLDPTFAGDGIQVLDFGGYENVNAVARQSNGKLVLAGSKMYDGFATVRLHANGELDTGFASGGIATGPVFSTADIGYGVAVHPVSNKIVVVGQGGAGYEEGYMAVARYEPDGDPDTTFSGDGERIIDFTDEWSGARDVALHGSRITIAGLNARPGTSQDDWEFAVARMDGGVLDTTFSGDGLARFNLPGVFSHAKAVVVHEGKVLLVGGAYHEGVFQILRLTGAGAKDATFGQNGVVTVGFDAYSEAEAVTIQPWDGRPVIAGYAAPGITGDRRFAVVRLHG